MGLDMYLSKRTYVKNWSFQKDEEKFNITVKKGNEISDTIKPERISYITEEIMYWRKANQIHNWFVQNVQDGEDDCKEYYVPVETIVELYQVVCEVLESRNTEVAAEKLSPAAGFFFGSTEIDDWYWQDLENTKEILQPLIDAYNEADKLGDKSHTHPIYKYDFYYQSSW